MNEPQEAEENEFFCMECHEPLMPLDDGKRSWWQIHGKQVMIGAAALVVLGGGGYGVSALLSHGKGDAKTAVAGDSLAATAPADSIEKARQDSIVKAKTDSTAKADSAAKAQAAEDGKAGGSGIDKGGTKPGGTTAGPRSLNLGYGRYTGDMLNGKPHGHGTITYTQSHRIVGSQDFVASPGDRFEGEFRNGKISGGIGYWYHNGDITAVRP